MAGVFPLLLSTQEAEVQQQDVKSTDPSGNEDEVLWAVRFATTFARKLERLSRTFLHEESAISKHS